MTAVESGTVTSLAISADYSTIAGGHATGHIFTWEIARPAKPFLHIFPLDRSQLDNRRSDGHVAGSAILHVGFLGTRHTALVSADDAGMAFSHLATRGLGAVGRTVKTTRILGRYPPVLASNERARKASSVLAFAPLPLGNVEQPTDGLGLTALLTPYLLVIVSTTPIAETQHKSARPKELAPHSALSGCLAWFPAVKLKNPSGSPQEPVSRTKLVYCWSNILTVLDVEASEAIEKDKPPNLRFQPRSRWRGEEVIVAVQWLSRSVLGVLTISQRLVILEDGSLRVTDSFDLLHKHIFHQDLFSRQLQPVVEQLDEEDTSMHGVVADAFYMSFRAYKGRLFLLGFNDVSIGTLSNWADRLLALMEDGDFIAAIRLATSYYNGDADKLSVGLPDDDSARHAIVLEKLREMITASMRYAFSRRQDVPQQSHESQLRDLTAASFVACMSMGELDFLFEDVYERYEEASAEAIFFEVLEPYILREEITVIPATVLKDLITHYASRDRASTLEEMICRLDTRTMDINQTTILCRQYQLYDALIYIWNQAIGDYISPLVELLSLVKVIGFHDQANDAVRSQYLASAMKIFSYLAYTFTGRVYPSGDSIPEHEALKAKADLYGFLFSGNTREWPPASGVVFLTRTGKGIEPSYPYLRLILKFDAASFMSTLNEAFEDGFLNGSQKQAANGLPGRVLGGADKTNILTPTRQTIIGILVDVMGSGDFEPEDAIYLDMFIARNLPKYPQFIILPGNALHRVLDNLCNYPSDDVADDCQLSVEYLLSFYHPPDIESLIPSFKSAGFYRVLKSVYRGTKQYAQLLETYFEDPENQEAVFDCIRDCLRPSSGLTVKQIRDVQAVVLSHARELAAIDTIRMARTLRLYAPTLLEDALNNLEDSQYTQYVFLRSLLELGSQNAAETMRLPDAIPPGFEEKYVQLMCRYHPAHVADYVNLLKSGDLRLDSVLPAMESSGVIDAAVVLMARDGLVRDAMSRLVKHMTTLETALTSLVDAAADSPDTANTEEAAEDLLDAVQKYCKVGIWLCQSQPRGATRPTSTSKTLDPSFPSSEEDLAEDELLWLDLIDSIVRITQNVSSAAANVLPPSTSQATHAVDTAKITAALRTAVQQTFTALLSSTTASEKPNTVTPAAAKPGARHPMFLRILRAFLTRASHISPSLSDLRAVLAEVFAAYTFEENILALSNRFLDKDIFQHVAEAHALRQRGWRPRGQVCEVCKRRVWGPGAGGWIWEAWERSEKEEQETRSKARLERSGGEAARRAGRGKGRVDAVDPADGSRGAEKSKSDEQGRGVDTKKGMEAETKELGPVVAFACRHMFHTACLERTSGSADGGVDEHRGRPLDLRCPLCP